MAEHSGREVVVRPIHPVDIKAVDPPGPEFAFEAAPSTSSIA
jgi:hypothetical protein